MNRAGKPAKFWQSMLITGSVTQIDTSHSSSSFLDINRPARNRKMPSASDGNTHLLESLAKAPPTSGVWDAGDLACGELVIDLRRRLMVRPGKILRVVSSDPGAPEDIPAWCRMTGHELISFDKLTSSFWIRARGSPEELDADGTVLELAEVDEIYNAKVFDLAKALPAAGRLAHPDATANARSLLCGSTIEVELAVRESLIVGYAQRIQACLLGRASASAVSRVIVGSPLSEVLLVGQEMRAMLGEGGKSPGGRWADLAALAPVRALKSRHPSTLLVFVAIERALGGLTLDDPPSTEVTVSASGPCG
jgi:NifU-like protein involved in Fe-S cluster formation/TusA-related sulfurtransferase